MSALRLAGSAAAAWALCAAAQAAPPPAPGPGYHVVDRIAGPDGGWDYVRVDAAHNQVLIAHGAAVTAVNLATKKVTPALASGVRLHDVMPVAGEVAVTNGGPGTVVFISPTTGAIVATVQAGKNPDAETYDAHSGLVLVMNHSGGDITLVDPRTHKAVGVIVVGGDLEAAVVDGAGHAFVNVEDKNQIAELDVAARKVLARYPLAGCDGPTGLAYDAADKLLIAACDGAIDVVDARSGKVLQTLVTGKGADGVAYDAKRRLAFVPAGRDGTLAVIAVARTGSRVVETVPTQASARTIALDERTGRLYLPAAKFAPPAQAGGRPTLIPGSFELIVVAP